MPGWLAGWREQQSLREKSRTERIALGAGVRAREQLSGQVRPRRRGTCGDVGAARSMVRASKE